MVAEISLSDTSAIHAAIAPPRDSSPPPISFCRPWVLRFRDNNLQKNCCFSWNDNATADCPTALSCHFCVVAREVDLHYPVET